MSSSIYMIDTTIQLFVRIAIGIIHLDIILVDAEYVFYGCFRCQDIVLKDISNYQKFIWQVAKISYPCMQQRSDKKILFTCTLFVSGRSI